MPESVYSYSYTQPHSLYTVHRTRGRGSLPAAPKTACCRPINEDAMVMNVPPTVPRDG